MVKVSMGKFLMLEAFLIGMSLLFSYCFDAAGQAGPGVRMWFAGASFALGFWAAIVALATPMTIVEKH